MAALYFTVTGVQFWGTSYMTVALGAQPTLVHALFVLVAATGGFVSLNILLIFFVYSCLHQVQQVESSLVGTV
jgi:hypothetical protein